MLPQYTPVTSIHTCDLNTHLRPQYTPATSVHTCDLNTHLRPQYTPVTVEFDGVAVHREAMDIGLRPHSDHIPRHPVAYARLVVGAVGVDVAVERVHDVAFQEGRVLL